MFSRLSKWFSRNAGADTGSGPKTASDDLGDRLPLIPAAENPWGVDIIDCRAVSQVYTSTTSDRSIAQSFLDHRHSDGHQYLSAEPLPYAVAGSIRITTPNSPPEGTLFRAQEMEDKWDVFHLSGQLYAARSWTGALLFQGKVSYSDGITTIDEIRASAAPGETALRELHFLLAAMCLKRPTPAPLSSANMPQDGQARRQAALEVFSTFGRWGDFATTADLTDHPPIPFATYQEWLAAHPAHTSNARGSR
jgi:hypothetical protein